MKNLPFVKPFNYPDFRFLFASETCFFIPTWMAAMVFGLIATHIKGNSPWYVGLIGFGFNLPMLLGPFIGVFVDRNQRTTVMKMVSITAFLAALIMGLALFFGWPSYWFMFFLVLIYGFSMSFYYPAILTGTSDIIQDPKISSTAISIVNSNNRIMMFFGYALGGLLVTYLSEQWSFWVNAIFYLLSFLFLMFIRTQVTLPERKVSAINELKAGLVYIKDNPVVLAVIVLLALTGFLAWPYLFQIPVVNRYYLGGTPGTLGLLLAIGGIGGTVGAFLISARKTPLYLNQIFIAATILLSISMILLAFCRSVPWAIPVLFVIDFCLMVALTVGTIFIQLVIPKEFQGRIMGVISMVCFGTIPFGSAIFYGGIGESFGVMTAFVVAAILLLIGIGWYISQLPKIRQFATPIFLEKELIAQANEGYKI